MAAFVGWGFLSFILLFLIFYFSLWNLENLENLGNLANLGILKVATVSPILGFVGGRPQPRDRSATVDPKPPAQRRDRLGDPDQRSTPSTLLGHGSRPRGGGLWPGRLFY